MKNYIVYLVVQILCSLFNNIYSSRKAVKYYPFITNKEKMHKEERKEIVVNIKSMFLYKIGGVLLNNTDNILISTLVNTIMVGLYSNYSMIVQSIETFASMFFTSINASVGNLSVSKDVDYQFKIYKVVDFTSFLIYSFCSVCLFVLMGDFIQLCYGLEYRMDTIVCAIIVLNFYIPGIISANSVFRNATGMFKQMKYLLLVTSFINLILSIILGKIYGLLGIFLATGISRILTNVWYEPFVLYKKYFNHSILEYIRTHLSRDIVFFAITFVIYSICNIFTKLSFMTFALKLLICVILTPLLLIIVFWHTEEFKILRLRFINKIRIG